MSVKSHQSDPARLGCAFVGDILNEIVYEYMYVDTIAYGNLRRNQDKILVCPSRYYKDNGEWYRNGECK